MTSGLSRFIGFAIALCVMGWSCDTSSDPPVPNHKTNIIIGPPPNQVIVAGKTIVFTPSCALDGSFNGYYHLVGVKDLDTVHVYLGETSVPNISKNYELVEPTPGFTLTANQAAIVASIDVSGTPTYWISNTGSGQLKLSVDESNKVIFSFVNTQLQLFGGTDTKPANGSITCN